MKQNFFEFSSCNRKIQNFNPCSHFCHKKILTFVVTHSTTIWIFFLCKVDKMDKVDKVDMVDNVDNLYKVDRVNKVDKVDKSDKVYNIILNFNPCS